MNYNQTQMNALTQAAGQVFFGNQAPLQSWIDKHRDADGYLMFPDTQFRFVGANLSGMDLSNITFPRNFSCTRCNLVETNFRHSIGITNLMASNMANANFQETDLRKTNFRGTNLSGVNFSDANLADTNFQRAFITVDTDLTGAIIDRANIDQARYHGGYIPISLLWVSSAKDVDFRFIKTKDPKFLWDNFEKYTPDLTGANLSSFPIPPGGVNVSWMEPEMRESIQTQGVMSPTGQLMTFIDAIMQGVERAKTELAEEPDPSTLPKPPLDFDMGLNGGHGLPPNLSLAALPKQAATPLGKF